VVAIVRSRSKALVPMFAGSGVVLILMMLLALPPYRASLIDTASAEQRAWAGSETVAFSSN